MTREEAKHSDPYMPEVIVYCGPAGSGKTYRCASDPDYKSDGYCMLQQASGKAYFDGYEGRVWFGLMSLGDPYSPSQYSLPSSPSGEPESKRKEVVSSFTPRRSSSVQQDGLVSGGLSRATSIRIPSSSIDELPDFTSWNAQDDWMTDLWSTQNLN